MLFAATVMFAGCGDDGESDAETSVVRTVEVEMRDIEFSVDRLDVEAGETVRFAFRNEGELVHDAFIGDEDAQDEHEREARAADVAGDGHGDEHDDAGDDDAGITVEPGATGELTHTFEGAGTLLIGCHEPGHYDAGMKITIDVT